jgi:hypothetical protein
MANTFNYRSGATDVVRVPIASGTVVEIGELLKLSSGRAVKMATSTDNLTFIGVAEEAHRAVDPSGSISVSRPNLQTVYEYTLDAATEITYGDVLQWNADKTRKKSTTDAIAIAVRSQLAATTALCMFRPIQAAGNLCDLGDAS